MSRLLITGSRYWTNREQMNRILGHVWINEFYRDRDVVLVHGAARGADEMAASIWEGHGLNTEAHPADWHEFGKRAGVIRNQLMVDLGADLVVGFLRPESIGTKHCLKIAKEAGITTQEHWEQ